MRLEQSGGCFKAAGGVVVAGSHHHLQSRHLLGGFEQEVVEEFLRRGRGVCRVEHVARDEQGVGLFVLEGPHEPGQEVAVLAKPVVGVEGVAEVPVGSVQKFHGNVVCMCVLFVCAVWLYTDCSGGIPAPAS